MIFTVKLRTLVIAVLAMLTGLTSIFVMNTEFGTAASDWGVNFTEDGKPPEGNESEDTLKKNNTYFIGDTSKKKIYITFDAGYENGNTPAILDALKKHKVKAAFFVVGHYIKTAPDLVKRMVDEGHIVANHTNHHPDMSAISDPSVFKEELSSLEAMFKETTGKTMPKFYRPPQGKYCEDNLKTAKKLGYKTVLWSLAYDDWHQDMQPAHEDAMKKLTARIHPGAVVLLHSTSSTNAEILDELLARWKEMGYTFDTIDNLK